jgi:hypothetical protein
MIEPKDTLDVSLLPHAITVELAPTLSQEDGVA